MIKQELEKYKLLTGYNLHQLELDYMQNIVLKILYAKYDKLYFKGGTCLQKCFGIKRFSEDLDFNYEDIDLIQLMNYLKNYFPYDFSIKEHKKTSFGDTFSLIIKGVLYTGSSQSTCKLLLDFRKGDVYKKATLLTINPFYEDILSYTVLVLHVEEILAEKIRAILTRYKARDVYDLNELLLKNVTINLSLVNKKLKTYNKIFDKIEFEEKLEEKRKIYDKEISKLIDTYPDFETSKKLILEQLNKL
jgi:predicted nucleotidyltransferase component of viral defense system